MFFCQCIYIKNGICYERRRDLEGINNHLVIIDFTANKKYRLINMYHVYSTNDGTSPGVKFNQQLEAIKNSSTNNLFVIGDFNIDSPKKWSQLLWRIFIWLFVWKAEPDGNASTCEVSNLVQNSGRNNTYHLYTNDQTLISNISSIEPGIGDHLIIHCEIEFKIEEPTPIKKSMAALLKRLKHYETKTVSMITLWEFVFGQNFNRFSFVSEFL